MHHTQAEIDAKFAALSNAPDGNNPPARIGHSDASEDLIEIPVEASGGGYVVHVYRRNPGQPWVDTDDALPSQISKN